MASRIEQIIDDIEEYIDGCKSQTLHPENIIVNRENLEELVTELRTRTPKEIERYQKIISNKEAILADAQTKADSIIEKAQIKTDQLISEHQIMQQAYAQAGEVVDAAQAQAQAIVDNATNEANSIKMGAVQYTDDLLRNMENAINAAINAARSYNENYLGTLQTILNTVSANRAQLNPTVDDFTDEQDGRQRSGGELPNVEITANMPK